MKTRRKAQRKVITLKFMVTNKIIGKKKAAKKPKKAAPKRGKKKGSDEEDEDEDDGDEGSSKDDAEINEVPLINMATKFGMTALHFACELGKQSAAKALLAGGASINLQVPVYLKKVF